MQAIILQSFGDPDQLQVGAWPEPTPGAREIKVAVHATAINRADTLQRMGRYPPPTGESEILGLEMAGEVVEVGASVTRWKAGDRVFGLLGGGGYAEYAVLHEDMAMPIPDGWSFTDAAAIPEVYLTAFQAMHWIAGLQPGETILIHAGASGVGTAAIQLAKQLPAEVIVTASGPKHDLCLELGADHAIDYRAEAFDEAVLRLTNGEGAHVVIDFIAAAYWNQNMKAMRTEGRMVMLALMGGALVDKASLAEVLRKRLRIEGSTLRSRSLEYKIRLTQDFFRYAEPLFQQKKLRPVIDQILPWTEAAEAHRYMEANRSRGKVVLKVR